MDWKEANNKIKQIKCSFHQHLSSTIPVNGFMTPPSNCIFPIPPYLRDHDQLWSILDAAFWCSDDDLGLVTKITWNEAWWESAALFKHANQTKQVESEQTEQIDLVDCNQSKIQYPDGGAFLQPSNVFWFSC